MNENIGSIMFAACFFFLLASPGAHATSRIAADFQQCSLRCGSDSSLPLGGNREPVTGPRGKAGPAGPKGEPGRACDVSQNDVDALSARLDELDRNHRRLQVFTGQVERGYNASLHSCVDLQGEGARIDGVYQVNVKSRPTSVYCDMTDDHGGWLVIQKRFDGSVSFDKDFAAYTEGFGSASGEYWLGLQKMHEITKTGTWQLKIDLEDFYGDTAFAQYSEFRIGAGPHFIMTYQEYSGTAGDDLRAHNGSKFSTPDNDQDNYPRNCAIIYEGAWWYNGCLQSNLNAFRYGADKPGPPGVRWHQWKREEPMRRTTMKIRPVP